LPQKRGEIGFRQSLLQEQTDSRAGAAADAVQPDERPARHPADREAQPASRRESQIEGATPTSSASQPPPDRASLSKSRKAIHARLYGVPLVSFFRFISQLALIGATLAAWILVTKRLAQPSNTPPPNPSDDQNSLDSQDNMSLPITGSGNIFIHVAFAVAVLGQLLFLERCVFFMRAQRYAFLHPGMPMHSRGASSAMAFAPWHRPSLPSYAATLAQSGIGTGDVEDNAIAIPPPPAYGNTRGSTLLLASFLRNSLRRDARSDGGSESSRPASRMSNLSRPVSYASQNERQIERSDAARALQLAETLARLEDGEGSHTTDTHTHSSTTS